MEIAFAPALSAMIVCLWRYHQRKQLITQMTEELFAELTRQFEQSVIRITVEQHDKTIFFYETGSGRFVCKGNSPAEIVAAFSSLYPDRMASIDEGDATLTESILDAVKSG